MQQYLLNLIANFNRCIPGDVLRDHFIRGKYWVVILPTTALRRV